MLVTRQKTSFSISLLSISHSIYKHDAIADPSSMQDACHMNFVDLVHHKVSLAQK